MLYYSVIILSGLSGFVLSLSSADSQISHQPRCGTSVAPDGLFLLDENQPDSWLPITDNIFSLFQNPGTDGGPATGRQYVLVHFAPTPFGSSGCQLNWDILPDTQFTTYYGNHQVDVKTTTAYFPPFRPTWNTVIAGDPPTLGSGVFGTVNAIDGACATVNTAACSNSPEPPLVGGAFGLAFIFKFASWVEQGGAAAGLAFPYGPSAEGFTGPYLSYNC